MVNLVRSHEFDRCPQRGRLDQVSLYGLYSVLQGAGATKIAFVSNYTGDGVSLFEEQFREE